MMVKTTTRRPFAALTSIKVLVDLIFHEKRLMVIAKI